MKHCIAVGLVAILLPFSAAPQTITPPSGSGGPGTVTSVATGCGLTGGPVTTTGTISETVLTAAHNGSYGILTADCGKVLTTNTAAAWTIAQAGTTGFETGKFFPFNNVGASGSLTITATTSTFYGPIGVSGNVLTITAGASGTVFSDGTNYQVVEGGATGPSGPTGPTGPVGSIGPLVQKASPYTITLTDATNNTNFQSAASTVAFTLPSATCTAGQYFAVFPGPTFAATFVLAGGITANGQATITSLPAGSGTAGYAGYRFDCNPSNSSDWVMLTLTGATGVTGATGPTGPAGSVPAPPVPGTSIALTSITPSAGGGGNGVPLATDTLLYTSGTVPALAASACYQFTVSGFVASGLGATTIGLWLGTSLGTAGKVSNIYWSTSTDAYTTGTWCNQNGSQTAQSYSLIGARQGGILMGSSTGNTTVNTNTSSNKFFLTGATNNGSGVTTNLTITSFLVTQQ